MCVCAREVRTKQGLGLGNRVGEWGIQLRLGWERDWGCGTMPPPSPPLIQLRLGWQRDCVCARGARETWIGVGEWGWGVGDTMEVGLGMGLGNGDVEQGMELGVP